MGFPWRLLFIFKNLNFREILGSCKVFLVYKKRSNQRSKFKNLVLFLVLLQKML